VETRGRAFKKKNTWRVNIPHRKKC